MVCALCDGVYSAQFCSKPAAFNNGEWCMECHVPREHGTFLYGCNGCKLLNTRLVRGVWSLTGGHKWEMWVLMGACLKGSGGNYMYH